MKELTVIFFSSWKFAATFPVAVYAMKMSFTETLIYTNIGGLLGMVISVFLSDVILKLWQQYWPEKLKINKNKRIFTPASRRLIRIKKRYGLPGIVALSPVLLSIPLGAFLTVKYYGVNVRNMIWLTLGQLFWSVLYTLFYTQVKVLIG
ncbi:MAG: hypothetical protein JXQ80_06950 [Bacteroidales bacterium]|nr:hypothetical protein [Bacteroidales bacterium]